MSGPCSEPTEHQGGGGLCVYINSAWCSNGVKVDGQCSQDADHVIS